MTLGDLGADVVKVERPDGGDDTRAWGPPFTDAGVSTYYLGLNRNKRSVALDLGDAGDTELARELARRADVLIESFRPGLMARWGLDHRQRCRAATPASSTARSTPSGPSRRARACPATTSCSRR